MRSPQPRIATLVLCTPGGEVLGKLPPLEMRLPWWQDAEEPVARVRQRHGLEVRILRLLDASLPAPPGGAVTYLAEVVDAPAEVGLAPWDGVLAEHPLRLPYAEPGGPDRDLAWAAAALAEHGFRQLGAPQQVRTWNLSSLWRVPVVGETLWLKCVPPFFAHEGEVLARLQDGPVPRLVAHDGNRVLLREIPGEDQYDASRSTLLTLIAMLVRLQTQWIGREDELLGLGLPDWRAAAVSEAIDSVVRRTASRLPADDRRTVEDLVEGLPDRFRALSECGIPDSLVHGDFAPGNSRGDGERLVLLDWGDCGVGHPLFDQAAFTDRIPPDLIPAATERWNELWRQAVPGSDPERATKILAPVAAARQAVVYQGFLDHIEPSEHPYHRLDPVIWLSRAAEVARRATDGGRRI